MEPKVYNQPASPLKTIEELKETFKQRLNDILYKELTVDNIQSFADDALGDAVKLIQDILAEYQNNPVLEGDLSVTTNEQEDAACKILELQNVQEILQSISDKKSEIDKLSTKVDTNLKRTDEIITPPNNEGRLIGSAGESEFESKKIRPRLLTLMYILSNDVGITPEDCVVVQGVVTADMVRKEPYVRVEVPDLSRLIYICNEEENASYIFDTEILAKAGLSVENIDIDSKHEKNSLIFAHPGCGIRIIQSKYWRNIVSQCLQNPLMSQDELKSFTHIANLQSEFKKEFLPYDDFKQVVLSEYQGQSDVNVWYQEENKKHKNWPAAPDQMYKNKGWVGWPEFVNKENQFKREYLSFSDFKREAVAIYPGGSVQEWYKKEWKRHSNWPSNPDRVYEDGGWIGFPELVGIENRLKKEYLSFDDFKQDVLSVYGGQGDIMNWYQEEKKKHKNWPAAPNVMYKNKGWVGGPELVERDNRSKKEYPIFDDFKQEVLSVWPGGTGDVSAWYHGEYKKHKNWPAVPNRLYENKGWIGWSELVNKKKI